MTDLEQNYFWFKILTKIFFPPDFMTMLTELKVGLKSIFRLRIKIIMEMARKLTFTVNPIAVKIFRQIVVF